MSPTLLAYLLLALSPFFFSSNIIIGAIAVKTIEPFTLTFFRWGLAFLLILPFAWKALSEHRMLLWGQRYLVLFIAFLATGFSGTGVYWALKYTSATNGTLIYTTSPLLIIVMERLFRGRPISMREVVGILFAVCGVLFIVFKGSLEALKTIEFNSGDLLFVAAATSWAIYSVMSKKRVFEPVPTVGMFAIVALVGAILQMPFMLWEMTSSSSIPQQPEQWASLFGLAFFASVLAFLTYQYGIRVLGPATAGIFMYLLPPIGVVLAVVLLGEVFLPFHMIGLLLVMSGVVLATFPTQLLARRHTPV